MLRKYKVTLIDRRNSSMSDIEIEAEDAKDALLFAEFNHIQKSHYHDGPSHGIYKIEPIDMVESRIPEAPPIPSPDSDPASDFSLNPFRRFRRELIGIK